MAMTMAAGGFGSGWKLILRFYAFQAKKRAQYFSHGNMHPISPRAHSLTAFIEKGIYINSSVIMSPSLAVSDLYQYTKSFRYCTTCKHNPDDDKPPDNQSCHKLDDDKPLDNQSCRVHLVEHDDGASLQSNSTEDPDGERCAQNERSDLEDEIVKGEVAWKMIRDAVISASGPEEIKKVLDQEASMFNVPMSRTFLHLLNSLESNPQLALEVFNWKRRQSDMSIYPEEYSKSIVLAGRVKNIDLAVELFAEVQSRGINRATSVYNALMTCYICNGLTKKALVLFEDMKRDANCIPTIVTYNILLSTFGRSMLVDHMEMVNQAIKDAGLTPTVHTYNTLIAGYVTAWMWDEMERTFKNMEASSVKPNKSTYSLLTRGYAHSGQMRKMEDAFNYLGDQISQKEVPIIRAMICAYSKSTDTDKMKKIENLIQFIPEEDYRPWLDVILIRAYAHADCVKRMEDSISRALERKSTITTVGVARSVASTYFRHDAIERLEGFGKQAKAAGWKLCRSLYHARMVIYGYQNRLNQMENVLEEMKSSHFRPTKKTFLILYKAYMKFGKEDEIKWTLKRMDEAGFPLPEDSQIFWQQVFASLPEESLI